MGTALLDEGDPRRAAPAEGIAETGDELETRRAAAYNPDMMETGFFVETSSGMDLSSGMRRSQRCRDHSKQIDAAESLAGHSLGRLGMPCLRSRYSAAITAGSTRAAQNLNSGILPNGSSCGLVSTLAAASA